MTREERVLLSENEKLPSCLVNNEKNALGKDFIMLMCRAWVDCRGLLVTEVLRAD